MFDMISIGDTMQDVFLEMDPANAHLHTFRKESEELCFTFADKIPVKAKHDLIGGNSANAAVAFARLGFKTGFYTHVGDDEQGKRLIADLKGNDVHDDYIVVDEGKESNYNTVINLEAERTILIYHVHRHFVLPKLEAAKWIYLSSMGEGFEKIFPDLIKYVDEHKVNLCYQPGTFQLKYGAEKTKALLEKTKIFFVNKEEAELYTGIPKTDNFRKLLDGILKMGPEIVVITDGRMGAYVSDGREYLWLGIIEKAPRVEATGCGDSFSSAFAAAMASGETLAEALRWGQCEASSVIGKIGPQPGLLFNKQIKHLLDEYPQLQAVSLDENGRPINGHNV
ncbi:MAG: carbohydrate kinase family protein [bacterium]